MRCLSLVMIPLLVLSACAQGHGERGIGMTFTADGRMVDNTAANRLEATQRHIQQAVDKALGTGWASSVTITSLPLWRERLVKGDGDWFWTTAEVQVVLFGHGTPPLPLSELRDGIISYMTPLLVRDASPLANRLTVTLRVEEPLAKPVPDPRPPTAVGHSTSGQTYRVQAGDTLADITTLFYGSPNAWRQIVAANSGLDPAHLQPGTELVIPPLPSSAPPPSTGP